MTANGGVNASGQDIAQLVRCFAVELGADGAVFHRPDPLGQAMAAWSAGSTPAEDVVRELAPYGSSALEQAGAFIGRPPAGANGGWLTLAVGAPVRSPSGVEGALLAGFSKPPEQAEDVLQWTASAYAGAAALALRDSEFLRALVRASRYDELTGLLNYAALRRTLEDEVERAERHARPLSCCFVDLDNFKEINDGFGHEFGNRALAASGLALRRVLRVSDSVGRYGGDEFVALMPETGATDAAAVAARIRDAIAARSLEDLGREVSASCGVAGWAPGRSAADLLEDADRALAEAKARGTGVVVSQESPTTSHQAEHRGRFGRAQGLVR